MQRGAWLHFKMIIRIEKYHHVDYNSRSFSRHFSSDSSPTKSAVKSDNDTVHLHGKYPKPNLHHQQHSAAAMSEWNEEDLADEVEHQTTYKTEMTTRTSFDAVDVYNEARGKSSERSLSMAIFLKNTGSSSDVNAYDEDSANIRYSSTDYSISGNPNAVTTDSNIITFNNPIIRDKI